MAGKTELPDLYAGASSKGQAEDEVMCLFDCATYLTGERSPSDSMDCKPALSLRVPKSDRTELHRAEGFPRPALPLICTACA